MRQAALSEMHGCECNCVHSSMAYLRVRPEIIKVPCVSGGFLAAPIYDLQQVGDVFTGENQC